jgi:hypothetical protein
LGLGNFALLRFWHPVFFNDICRSYQQTNLKQWDFFERGESFLLLGKISYQKPPNINNKSNKDGCPYSTHPLPAVANPYPYMNGP